jgi:hypothetical protein
MAKARDSHGRWMPGVIPSEATPWQAGNKYRWQPGTSGNPGGRTQRHKEFLRLQREALQDPELLEMAMAKLKEAIGAGEAWSVQWFLNKVWPDDKNAQIPPGKLEVVFTERPLPLPALQPPPLPWKISNDDPETRD